MEAETHHKLRNQPRSKASLTAARTNANAIYCPPLLQAQIDLMSGTIHGDEKDFDSEQVQNIAKAAVELVVKGD